ncbi:TenA family transcriptional regulator [Dyella sp.]|uniref:TenA family transcriptional regulator n=1 Tax=Dyella sp. TaxID=1869338 RepID=UPI002D794BC0|nr:iron-containing redox enzyme family protein [Dyella sp.]HET6432499.1 iron-containing redox enzyme family protein [Dyella sp.]
MNILFERTGPLTELSSYPQWAQDMVADCAATKQRVLDHDIWRMMTALQLDHESTRNFMMGLWPFIERFPSFMALNLLKTRYGRSPGDDKARRWLVRNIRVEQNHAEYWLNWADGAGVARSRLLDELPPHGTDGLARWCEDISARGSLAAGMIATNYAIEGVTGEWSQMIYDSETYRQGFDPSIRTSALKWLHLHAAYDDTHPWEALEIVCTLMGLEPSADDVAHLAECIKRSYTSMILLGDRCIQSCPERVLVQEDAA